MTKKITVHHEAEAGILLRSAVVMVPVSQKVQGLVKPDWNHLISFREADWNEPGHPVSHRRIFKLPPEIWEDMGKPEEITLTIEVGDKLNGNR